MGDLCPRQVVNELTALRDLVAAHDYAYYVVSGFSLDDGLKIRFADYSDGLSRKGELLGLAVL